MACPCPEAKCLPATPYRLLSPIRVLHSSPGSGGRRWVDTLCDPALGTQLRRWHSFLGADVESGISGASGGLAHLGPRRNWSGAQAYSWVKDHGQRAGRALHELKHSCHLLSLRGNN